MSCIAFTRITKGMSGVCAKRAQTCFFSSLLHYCHLAHFVFRYVRSLVSSQLGGKNKAPSTLGQCAPQQYVDGTEGTADPTTGDVLTDNAAVDPCGLMPYSYFNDSYVMSQQQPGGDLTVIDMDVSSALLHLYISTYNCDYDCCSPKLCNSCLQVQRLS